MKILSKKSNLDEMQELKLLRIEHRCFWLLFWGLSIVIAIKNSLLNPSYVLGENLLFFSVCIYMVCACIKNGIWDRRLQPNKKTNLLLSIIAGIAAGGINFFTSYYKYHKLIGSFATFCFVAIFTTILTMFLLSATAAVYKRKKAKLENEEEL